jgi:hypothetical protein
MKRDVHADRREAGEGEGGLGRRPAHERGSQQQRHREGESRHGY